MHDRSTKVRPIFGFTPNYLIQFGRKFFTEVFWFSKPMALLNYLFVSSISLVVQRQTTLEIWHKNLRYFYICIGFELCLWSIVGLPGSCACLLHSTLFGQVCKGRTTAIVLPAHMVKHLSGESRKLTVTISVNWSRSDDGVKRRAIHNNGRSVYGLTSTVAEHYRGLLTRLPN